MLRRLLGLGLFASLLGLALVVGLVSAHDKVGPHKKLFLGRWYQQVIGGDYATWMTLSTSRTWYLCDATEATCASKWASPASGAYQDWNGKPMTVDFDVHADQNVNYDVNVVVVDSIAGLPDVLGIAFFSDILGNDCDPDLCTFWYTDLFVADDNHDGSYGTTAERQGTIAHELGHALSLAHESASADSSEHFECGQDEFGQPIPHSVMAYDCIDPIAVGGSGETYVQDFDACGVNHAYYDPGIGYALCGAATLTPTPSPTRTPTRTATPVLNTPTPQAGDGAIKNLAGCATNNLPANDDGSSGLVSLPFTPNFFNTSYNGLYVNNNGNVTFDGPLITFTPFDLTSTSQVIIAPFFADVDTRGGGSGLTTYGSTTFSGRPAFCASWINVGYYNGHTDKLNSFQLLLVDRSDVGVGDFDIIMNYNQVQWETGDVSGGTNGLGGSSARAGYSNGVDTAFELPGSAVNGAFLDSSPGGLANNSRGSVITGRYIFAVRGGQPVLATATPTNTPLPPTDTPTDTPTGVPPTETPTSVAPPTDTPTPIVPTATHTPTLVVPTDTPTFTRTPTRTPTPQKALGDVNDDGTVSSVDALLVLQFDASLIPNLANAPSADVNENGAVNSIDAALILQYVAGIIDEL